LLHGLFGAFMGGGSSGLIALAAIYYPTTIRSTGVGWAMGMGRVGSFVGPLAVGSLVAVGLSTAGIPWRRRAHEAGPAVAAAGARRADRLGRRRHTVPRRCFRPRLHRPSAFFPMAAPTGGTILIAAWLALAIAVLAGAFQRG
jgi:hypothetical protein